MGNRMTATVNRTMALGNRTAAVDNRATVVGIRTTATNKPFTVLRSFSVGYDTVKGFSER